MESGGGGGEVRVFDSVEDLSTELVEHIAGLSEASVKERGGFSIALSGGAGLLSLLKKLCQGPYLITVDWSKWHVFWAEENVVPKNHPDSHYKLAKDTFFSILPLVPSQMIPAMPAARATPSPFPSAKTVAADYEYRLRQLVRSRIVDVSMSSDCPRFDLVVLLLGPGGRVAALYPDNPVPTTPSCPWVASVRNRNPSRPETSSGTSWKGLKKNKKVMERQESVTMTVPVINSAAHVVVVAVGTAVADALADAIRHGGGDDDDDDGACFQNPAKMISPTNGKLIWFVDSDAASLLGSGNN